MLDGIVWNPLQRGDHALDLAAALNLKIECLAGQSIARTFDNRFAGACDYPTKKDDGFGRDFAGDKYAATRRAIVLAAADIGRSKLHESK